MWTRIVSHVGLLAGITGVLACAQQPDAPSQGHWHTTQSALSGTQSPDAPPSGMEKLRIDGLVWHHKGLKQRLLQLAPDDAALERSWLGLSDHAEAETCALYVHKQLTQTDIATLRQDGIVITPDIWVPPLPSHRHPWGFHVATIPYAAMAKLMADPNVVQLTSLEVPAYPANDNGRSAIHAVQVNNGNGLPARDGTGVKVCIADTGVDLTNSDFSAPAETFDMTTGTSTADWATLVANKVSNHGTHVSGTLLGNGGHSNGVYKGVAPGVTWNFYKIGDDKSASSSVADQIEAISRSSATGCQIFSMSFWSEGREVDGSAPDDQIIDVAHSLGMTSFICAGNAGTFARHVDIGIPAGSIATVTFAAAGTANTTPGVGVFWQDGNPNDGNLTLTWANGTISNADPTSPTPRGTEFIQSVWPGGAQQFTLTNTGNAESVARIYLRTPFNSGAQFTSPPPIASRTIGSPALADSAVAVGSWVTRSVWEDWKGNNQSTSDLLGTVSSFSSLGPRIDGVMKPQFVAPGQEIISVADSVVPAADWLRIDDDGNTLDGSGPANYFVDQGTSMATPMAAGAAALLLEAHPNATPDYIVWAMSTTSSAYNSPDYAKGYGLIDIKAAILTHKCGDGILMAPEACDDGNTKDGDCCSAQCIAVATCDDGNACTGDGTCLAGQCQPGVAITCDDSNMCTNDSCNPASGCGHAFNSLGCDDGNACTIGETCSFGACVGFPKFCFDGDQCTEDACNSSDGACKFLPYFGVCNDGNACTDSDLCVYDGQCSGMAKLCADSDPCTLDSCTPATGICQHIVNTNAACDDGNLCTTFDFCHVTGVCAGTLKSCVDSDPCTADSCNAATGNCQFLAHFGSCDDGDKCTVGDVCNASGTCSGTVNLCDDGNFCTNDDCVVATGNCTHTNTSFSCNDGDDYTVSDKCSNGTCSGTPYPCSDGDNCTVGDHLTAAGCVATPMNCSDGDPCTDDFCYAPGGFCYSQPKVCGDGTTCTADSCDPKTGDCLHVPTIAPCSDPFWCTIDDTCVDGVCVGTPKVCKDGDPCTQDTCYEGNGDCYFPPATGACSDGNPCTSDDFCENAACKGGGATVCSDGNSCTFDTCDKSSGCVFSLPIASYPACDDGEVCSSDSFCYEGSCVAGSPLNCSDGDPCTNDSCVNGQGCAHLPGNTGCDDSNPCTTDTCDLAGDCTHTAFNGGCDDYNVCTLSDYCVGGTCTGKAKVCGTDSACVTFSCDALYGCQSSNTTAACDDGNVCTVGDSCVNGSCGGGEPLSCEDANPCTIDSCDSAKGCVHVKAVGNTCDDGDPCTTGDQCAGVNCVGTPLDGCGADASDAVDGAETADDAQVVDVPVANDSAVEDVVEVADGGAAKDSAEPDVAGVADAAAPKDAAEAEAGLAADVVDEDAEDGADSFVEYDPAGSDVLSDVAKKDVEAADAKDVLPAEVAVSAVDAAAAEDAADGGTVDAVDDTAAAAPGEAPKAAASGCSAAAASGAGAGWGLLATILALAMVRRRPNA